MFDLKYIGVRKGVIYVAVIFLLLVGVVMLFGGTWLIREDDKHKGDAIVLLMGPIADRVLEASDLYQQGYAGQILMVEESMGPYRLLEERGAHMITRTIQCRSLLEELIVPASGIEIIPGEATSTLMEANLLSKYLQSHDETDTLLVVTSKAHTRRASLILRRMLNSQGHSVTVIMCPSGYDNFIGKGWFMRREAIQEVVFEYVKMFGFILIEQHRI